MKTFKRNPKQIERAAESALAWIEKQTEGLVIDCKDELRLALYGTLRPVQSRQYAMDSLAAMKRAKAKAGL